MKKIIFSLLVFITSPVFALSASDVNNAGFNELTEQQKIEILKVVADKKEQVQQKQQQPSVPDVEKLDQWATVGTKVGQGLAAAAKEVGVTVNDFAKTPVGKLTAFLIVWNFIGAQLVHIIGGILIWIVGFGFLHYWCKNSYPDAVKYSKTEKNIFGNYAIESIEKNSMTSSDNGAYLFFMSAIILTGLATIFTF